MKAVVQLRKVVAVAAMKPTRRIVMVVGLAPVKWRCKDFLSSKTADGLYSSIYGQTTQH